MQLSLTPRAAEAALSRARDAEVAGWLLRVAVVAGGCNGLTYDLFFIPEPGPEDAVVEVQGLRVAVDRASQNLLDGTVIDFPKGTSFHFQNPRARKACSCGASFEV
ncbi:MAG TPA: iron-sulfur cluster assembly accessory protein [Myxococcales bacterium]|jgi:iron-sulfur cluster assembly protein|nr:iron-sulfur cluster assembly accessory protein [Myxococcales bacterium]